MEMSNMVKPTVKTTIKPREDAATAGWKALFETFNGALDAMVAFSPCTPSRDRMVTMNRELDEKMKEIIEYGNWKEDEPEKTPDMPDVLQPVEIPQVHPYLS
jgi:hypothetical protein